MTTIIRRRGTHEVSRRASERDPKSGKCIVLGCHRPTQRSAGRGLSDEYCKRHIEWIRRHGVAWRGSLTVAEIAPYRRAAQAWLREHRADASVVRVAAKLEGRLASAGPARNAYSLRGLSPQDRAWIALARLREAGVPGARLLEITLTVKAAIGDGVGPRGHREFLLVQIAKQAHRLASGTYLSNRLIKMRPKHPRPEGRVMRVLGQLIADHAEIVANTEVVEEVIKMARSSHRAHGTGGIGPAKSATSRGRAA